MPPASEDQGNPAAPPLILFDVGKKELFSPTNGLKHLHRRLRSSWKISIIKDEITLHKLKPAKLVAFIGPRQKFSAAEFEALKQYIREGGSVLLSLGEGGETRFDTNVNFLLEEFGVLINNDAVVRTAFFKYHHPKECLVSNGILNREITKAAGKKPSGNPSQHGLSFVYPYGATLTVQKPAVAVLSSGSVSLPLNRPTCAFHASKSGGKIAVLGSSHMFQDQYFDKEDNMKIADVLVRWLTSTNIQLNPIDAEDPDVADYHFLPDVGKLAERPRVCLQDGEEVPRDFTTLFEHKLYQLDTDKIPQAVRAYSVLNLEHEPLQLISPQFETPLPPLQPAVFPPSFRELQPPALDLFDLDDAFSSEHVRLAQLTNNCTEEDDLEYYVRECGTILGISNQLPPEKCDGKHILEFVLKKVVEFKKLNQE
eukprot:m.91851 g.91851  ORF g.91851 m.91851 type:complete len:425 (+) comp21681_c0_seq3:61-1335(+)